MFSTARPATFPDALKFAGSSDPAKKKHTATRGRGELLGEITRPIPTSPGDGRL